MAGDLLSELQSQDQGRIDARSDVANQDPEDQELADKVQQDIDKVSGEVETWRAQGKEDNRYYYGNQWQDLDRFQMEQQKRPALVYNEIGDKVDALSGLERLNRTDIRFVTRSPDTDLLHDTEGDLATDAVAAANDLCFGPREESRIAKDVAITGMGWGEVYMSFEEDLDGRVTFKRHNNMQFFWDTKAEQENLDDARWVDRRRPFSRKEFRDRWPDKIDLVDASAPSYPEYQVGKYELVTPYYSLANEKANPNVGQQNAPKKEIVVDQYQWRDYVEVYRIADQQNPEALQELSASEWKTLKERAELMGMPPPVAVRQMKPIWKQVYVANGIVLEKPIELGPSRTLICATGQYDSDKKVWYGLVRGLKDPQNTMNKAISAVVWQFITGSKNKTLFKKGTFEDPLQAKRDWAQEGAFIEAGANVNFKTDIFIPPPSAMSQAPPLLFMESQKAIARISGINEAVEGLVEQEQSAPTVGKRIQAALAVLGWFFDNLECFRMVKARIQLDFIRDYWSFGQLVRVGGDFNSKAIPLLKQDLRPAAEYDLVVDQSVKYNPNLKQTIWEDLMAIAGPLMRSPVGQQFLLKALKYSPLPAQLVAELQQLAQQAPLMNPQKGGQKGQQGAQQKPPEAPQLVAAKITKMNADAERAKAQARNLDKKSGIEVAKLFTDTSMRAVELQQAQQQAQHEAHMRAQEMQEKRNMLKQKLQQQQAASMMGGMPQQQGGAPDQSTPPGMI